MKPDDNPVFVPEITAETIKNRMRAAIDYNQQNTTLFDTPAQARPNTRTNVRLMALISAPLRRLVRLASRLLV